MGAHGKRTAKCSTAAAGHSYPPILIIFFIFFALMTLVFLGTPHRHSCFTVEEVTWASHPEYGANRYSASARPQHQQACL